MIEKKRGIGYEMGLTTKGRGVSPVTVTKETQKPSARKGSTSGGRERTRLNAGGGGGTTETGGGKKNDRFPGSENLNSFGRGGLLDGRPLREGKRLRNDS